MREVEQVGSTKMSNIGAAEWTYHRSPKCHWTGIVNTSLLHSSSKCQFRIAKGKAFIRTLLGWPSESHLFWFGRRGAVLTVLRLLGCTLMSRRFVLRERYYEMVTRVTHTAVTEWQTRWCARHVERRDVGWGFALHEWLGETNGMWLLVCSPRSLIHFPDVEPSRSL
jgi:hypothetical protein